MCIMVHSHSSRYRCGVCSDGREVVSRDSSRYRRDDRSDGREDLARGVVRLLFRTELSY